MVDLDLSPWTTTRLTLADAPALQRLCDRCSEYFEMEEGVPTPRGAAEHVLKNLPPRNTYADKHDLGIVAPGGELVGVLDLVRDCPAESEWWLGLLLLAPDARSAGLGSRILGEVERVIAAAGGTAIYLGVLEQNGPGERFWRRHGFAELRRQPYTSATGHPSRVIVMCHRLGSAG
jgi:GNAT superfamily N-acetyltransferase